MTRNVNSPAKSAGSRPPLVTRPLLLRFVSIVGASTGFFLLLSVVPLYAEASSGGRGSAAGLATGALMLATVAGELATPRIVARFGYRLTLVAGLLLLGAPALVLTVSGSTAWITAVCVVRGLGFACTVVAGGALTASLIPPERRGEGLALVGIVSGVPSLVALPLGVWLVAHVGYGPVCVAGGVAALAAIVSVPGLPDREPDSGPSIGVVAGLRTAGLLRPAIVFAATTLAAGIVVTFLPLAVPSASTGLVPAAPVAPVAAAPPAP
ncbi:MFS transporter, partial [Streptomyces sp. NPDC059524]|uniref:MFS transporter n=1 Tax=Streptomyces sp. NPDC059524 TaxID=3346856 RepID=UPI0036BC1860